MKSYTPDQLDEIIRKCQRGDRKHQKLIYEMFYGKMLGVCIRYAGHIDLAKDFLQDGFIKAFIRLKKYDFKGSFEGWLRRIIVNNIIDLMRKQRVFFTDGLMLEQNLKTHQEVDDYDDSEMGKLKKLTSDEILQQVQSLSPAYRAVFNLYVVEGFSHKEIAKMLDISEGSSKSNLARAKLKLQKLIKNYYELKYGKIEIKNI